jgi:hypothetical protein
MSQYLTPLASLPGTAPSPLMRLGGIPYGQQAAPSAAIYDLGGTSCVPGGSALRAPAPYDNTFMGPQLRGIPYGQQAAPSAAIYNMGGASCVPGGSALRAPAPMTLLSRGLVARIQKRIFLGCPYAMGFDWQPRTLLSLMGGILDLHHLHPRAAPLFRCFGVLMGGLHSPPLLLLVIMGCLHPPPLILLVIMVGLPSPPLLLGL